MLRTAFAARRAAAARPPPPPRGAARQFATSHAEHLAAKNRRIAYGAASVVAGVVGVTYASVPLYKVFCQVTGFGGTTQRLSDEDAKHKMTPAKDGRVLRVTFTSACHDAMPWTFVPTQCDVKVVPGETALAFFTANNPTDQAITGVATYNVHPPKAGLYFNKIQCFCFEEQRLRAREEVDMPVLFVIDPDFLKDPAMEHVNSVTLSYTFFKTSDEDGEYDVDIPYDDDDDDEDDDDDDDDDAETAAAPTANLSASDAAKLAAANTGSVRLHHGGTHGKKPK